MTATVAPNKAKKPRAREVADVVQDAAILGVNRDHLARCLRGERHSPKLLARYQALKASQASQAEPPVAPVPSNRMVKASQVHTRK